MIVPAQRISSFLGEQVRLQASICFRWINVSAFEIHLWQTSPLD